MLLPNLEGRDMYVCPLNNAYETTINFSGLILYYFTFSLSLCKQNILSNF